MRIAFDSWVLASRLRWQGTHVYARNLITQFKQIAGRRADTECCLFTCREAKNDANQMQASSGFALAPSNWLQRDRLWRMTGANRAARAIGADVLFSPTSNIFPAGKVPVVCTIHDATPLFAPSHSCRVILMLRAFLASAVKRSRAIIAVSQHSRSDLLERYGVPEEKIFVVYNGCDKSIFNQQPVNQDLQQAVSRRFGLSRPYLFHHGVIQPRKNLKRLIEAYRLLLARNRNLDADLVLAGPPGWNCDEILAAAADSGQRGRVVLTGAVGDRELAALLHGANLVVIPSLYEGFCLPMVEAMACGVPTIASRASCLPEVSGNVLRYFDPLQIEDIATCMQQALENESLREELSRRGKERAACFDWQRCAEETLSIITRHARKGTN